MKFNNKGMTAFLMTIIFVVIALVIFTTFLYTTYQDVKEASDDSTDINSLSGEFGVDIDLTGEIEYDALENVDPEFLDYVDVLLRELFVNNPTKHFRKLSYFKAHEFPNNGIRFVDRGDSLAVYVIDGNKPVFYGDGSNYDFLKNVHLAVPSKGWYSDKSWYTWSDSDDVSFNKLTIDEKHKAFASLFLLSKYCTIFDYKTHYINIDLSDAVDYAEEEFMANNLNQDYIIDISNYIYPAQTLSITSVNEDIDAYDYDKIPEVSFKRFDLPDLKNANHFFSKDQKGHLAVMLDKTDSNYLIKKINGVMPNFINTTNEHKFLVLFPANDGNPSIKIDSNNYEIEEYGYLNYEAIDLIFSKINSCS